jgi:hypothetical protein
MKLFRYFGIWQVWRLDESRVTKYEVTIRSQSLITREACGDGLKSSGIRSLEVCG